MADTGLLISMAFDEKDIQQGQLYKKLMFDKLEVNKGMIVENIVAQMLRASDNKLFFYSKSSSDSEERMEIDFLVRKPSVISRHNISPIEVKSSGYKTHKSLDLFCEKFSSRIGEKILLYTKDYQKDGEVLCIPAYFAWLM